MVRTTCRVAKALAATATLALALALALAPSAAAAATPVHTRWSEFARPGSAAASVARPAPASVGVLAADANEPDDEPGEAKPIATDGTLVAHTLEALDPTLIDQDFSSFTATAGHTYSIEATAADSVANPVLYFGDLLYIIAYNDAYLLGQRDAKLCWTCDISGTYLVMVRDDYARGGSYNLSVTDEGEVPSGRGARIGGADRYYVAASLAATQFPDWSGVQHVIVASGVDRAASDPLTASGVAGVYNAPVLLINQYSPTRTLPTATKRAIQGIWAKCREATPSADLKVHFIGSTVSVPSWVQTRIAAIAPGCKFDRIGGPDRYAVSANVAARMRSVLGTTPAACLVANGETSAFFFDALAASPIAFSRHYPILLTRKTWVPGAPLYEWRNRYAETYVVGNTYEVDTRVLTTLGGATRIGTARSSYDRTYVARKVAEYSLTQGWLSDRARFCVANKLPDALTGGCFAGAKGAPLLYSAELYDLGEHTEDYVQQSRMQVQNWWAIGGTPSVSGAAYARLVYLTGQGR